MLSKRALKYLNTFQRKDAEKDTRFLKKVLEGIGVIETETIIEFQIKYGGIIEKDVHFEATFGIMHRTPKNYHLVPNMLDWEKENDRIILSAADTHISYGILIDEKGIYYQDCIPNATSFELKLERDAYWFELQNKFNSKYCELKFDSYNENVVEEFMDSKIDSLSDEYCSYYFKYETLLINRFGIRRSSNINTKNGIFSPRLYTYNGRLPKFLK